MVRDIIIWDIQVQLYIYIYVYFVYLYLMIYSRKFNKKFNLCVTARCWGPGHHHDRQFLPRHWPRHGQTAQKQSDPIGAGLFCLSYGYRGCCFTGGLFRQAPCPELMQKLMGDCMVIELQQTEDFIGYYL